MVEHVFIAITGFAVPPPTVFTSTEIVASTGRSTTKRVRIFVPRQETDQIKVFQTVHEKMGIAGKMKPLGFHVNANTKGTFANQVYETEFSLGKTEEQFVWRIKVNDALLVSYHAESSNFR